MQDLHRNEHLFGLGKISFSCVILNYLCLCKFLGQLQFPFGSFRYITTHLNKNYLNFVQYLNRLIIISSLHDESRFIKLINS